MKPDPPPLFDAALLHEIACAIEKRGKAIRYRGRMQCSRLVEGIMERLDVNFAGHRIRITLSVWGDGQMWMSLTQPGPSRTGGWAHEEEVRSHVAEFDGVEACRRFEQTIGNPEAARTFWPDFSNR